MDLKKTHIGLDGKAVHWQEATARADGFLDLRRDLSPTPMTVGYTLVYVHAPKATDAVMLIGSDDEFAVWLNGTEIHRKRINAGATADADAVPVSTESRVEHRFVSKGRSRMVLGSLFAVHGCGCGSQICYPPHRVKTGSLGFAKSTS